MLQVSPWTRIITALIVLGGILIALPNALSDNVLKHFPSWMPSSTVSLGLDLQGGSYLLLEVQLDQVQKDKTEALVGDIRAAFRKAHIGYTDLGTQGDTVSVKVSDAGRYDEAKKLLSDLNPRVASSVLSVGAKQYDMGEPGGGVVTLHMSDAYKTQTQQQILEQSIEVVRRRIDEMGTREPDIARQGEDRILVQVPGLQDPDRLKAILGKTAKMTFQLDDEAADPNARTAPIGDEILPLVSKIKGAPPLKVVVQRRVMVAGDRLTDAGSSFDSRTNEPVVTFRFDSVGAREFGDVTKENVNHRFAIVLDKQVIMNANIIEPILGGSRPDHRHRHQPGCQRPCHSAARRRLARAVAHPGRTHRGRRTGRGFGEGRAVFGDGWPRHGRGVHDPALRAVRAVRRYRADPECGAAAGHIDRLWRHADASRHCRHRSDHGYGGGRQCADL